MTYCDNMVAGGCLTPQLSRSTYFALATTSRTIDKQFSDKRPRYTHFRVKVFCKNKLLNNKDSRVFVTSVEFGISLCFNKIKYL